MRDISVIMVSMAPNEFAHNELYRKGLYRDVLEGLKILRSLPDNIQEKVVVQIRKSLSGKDSISPVVQELSDGAKFGFKIQDYEYSNWGGGCSG